MTSLICKVHGILKFIANFQERSCRAKGILIIIIKKHSWRHQTSDYLTSNHTMEPLWKSQHGTRQRKNSSFIFLAVIKYHGKWQLSEESVYLVPNSRLQSITSGTSRQEFKHLVHHFQSREQRESKHLHLPSPLLHCIA